MSDHAHHEHLIKELTEMLSPVFENSPQAIYLYLDDVHKICNQKFADLAGYKSIQDWVDNEAPVSDVVEADQDKVIEAYGAASRNFKASQVLADITRQDGKVIKTQIIMVPLSYRDEVFVLHFVDLAKGK